jgi:hypothetical protein
MVPTPTVLGLIICEQVIFDRDTNNPSLINIFSGMRVQGFPSEPKSLSLFTTLTNSEGNGTMEVRCVHIDTQDEVYCQAYPLSMTARRVLQNIRIRVSGLEFKAPGWHEFFLLIDGDIVGQRRFRVYSPDASSSGVLS